MFRQYSLVSGVARRVGWIDHEPPLKRGTVITLKGDDREWAVEHAGVKTLDHPPDTTWQVGGITGRMRSSGVTSGRERLTTF